MPSCKVAPAPASETDCSPSSAQPPAATWCLRDQVAVLSKHNWSPIRVDGGWNQRGYSETTASLQNWLVCNGWGTTLGDQPGCVPVDGRWGRATCRGLQSLLVSTLPHVFGRNTPIDGSMGRITSSALQTLLVNAGVPGAYVDGSFGTLSIKWLQRYLNSMLLPKSVMLLPKYSQGSAGTVTVSVLALEALRAASATEAAAGVASDVASVRVDVSRLSLSPAVTKDTSVTDLYVEVDLFGLGDPASLRTKPLKKAATVDFGYTYSVAVAPGSKAQAELSNALRSADEQDTDVYFTLKTRGASGERELGQGYVNLRSLLRDQRDIRSTDVKLQSVLAFIKITGRQGGEVGVDGSWGAQTTTALQQFLTANGWKEGAHVDGSFGASTIKALQQFLNTAVPDSFWSLHESSIVDGSFGNVTQRALQTFLCRMGYARDGAHPDGSFGRTSATALQKFLNWCMKSNLDARDGKLIRPHPWYLLPHPWYLLEEDGSWGMETTCSLQNYLQMNNAFTEIDGSFGKHTTRTLQGYLAHVVPDVCGQYGMATDGAFGPVTKPVLQVFLFQLRLLEKESVTGEFGAPSIIALQKFLNSKVSPASLNNLIGRAGGEVGVDGSWGAQTTTTLQQFLTANGWKEGAHIDGSFGASTIKALQQFLNTNRAVPSAQSPKLPVDGGFGGMTKRALQIFLCRMGFPAKPDGNFGKASATLLQKFLNSVILKNMMSATAKLVTGLLAQPVATWDCGLSSADFSYDQYMPPSNSAVSTPIISILKGASDDIDALERAWVLFSPLVQQMYAKIVAVIAASPTLADVLLEVYNLQKATFLRDYRQQLLRARRDNTYLEFADISTTLRASVEAQRRPCRQQPPRAEGAEVGVAEVDAKESKDAEGAVVVGVVPVSFPQVLRDARNLRARFDRFITTLASRSASEVRTAPLKGAWRALEKIVLSPKAAAQLDAGGMCDVLRGSVKSKGFVCLCTALQLLQSLDEQLGEGVPGMEEDRIRLVRIKDRFETPTSGGWADMLVNFTFADDESQHVCELQLQHEMLLVVRKEGGAHAAYNNFRSALELLESVGKPPNDSFEEQEDAFEAKKTARLVAAVAAEVRKVLVAEEIEPLRALVRSQQEEIEALKAKLKK